MMNLETRKAAFVKCGLFIKQHFNDNWDEKEKGLHQGLDQLIDTALIYNGWFIKDFVKEALLNISAMLDEKSIADFAKNIPEPKQQKTVAIIMAGNIPMVGFHDLLCVLLSGHKVLLKLSSDDNVLMPFFIKLLEHYEPSLGENIKFSEAKLVNFDAVIATGTNNTASHFQYYFGKYPNIIRKNRTSVAVITGKESLEDLKNLGRDIFLYFGLGCRNVSKLLVPKGFVFDPVFEAVFDYKFAVDNKKYGNNYDYNRAIYLLNLDKFLDNNFLIIKEDKGLFSPVSVLYYQEFDSETEVKQYLEENKENIQCIVGKGPGFVPFGYSQQPVITEYADGVDTLNFLVNL
ncbi:MAG: acyl-CoA reductase [Bacteroidia bacterium]|nr:acyl-CoA reductase [Bacteroidia bacterium]